jgi:hypothetical protein
LLKWVFSHSLNMMFCRCVLNFNCTFSSSKENFFLFNSFNILIIQWSSHVGVRN